VTIVASMVFADLSGSATANTAAIGSVMIPGAMKKGYSAPFAVPLRSVAGSLGPLSPV
jgi:TRAP-type C4-dicarboxylate transport system permease large subunit